MPHLTFTCPCCGDDYDVRIPHCSREPRAQAESRAEHWKAIQDGHKPVPPCSTCKEVDRRIAKFDPDAEHAYDQIIAYLMRPGVVDYAVRQVPNIARRLTPTAMAERKLRGCADDYVADAVAAWRGGREGIEAWYAEKRAHRERANALLAKTLTPRVLPQGEMIPQPPQPPQKTPSPTEVTPTSFPEVDLGGIFMMDYDYEPGEN